MHPIYDMSSVSRKSLSNTMCLCDDSKPGSVHFMVTTYNSDTPDAKVYFSVTFWFFTWVVISFLTWI